jgi:predicted Zn finger-like uncharacterized protein
LIVECERCSTRFQLDESRVPAQGIRVRCSRCKYAFFLSRPGTAPAEAADAVVEETLRGRGATPAPTRDLSQGGAPSAPPGLEDEEESDWEFNADVPGEDELGGEGAVPPPEATADDDTSEGRDDSASSFGRPADFSAAEEDQEEAPAPPEETAGHGIERLLAPDRDEGDLGEPESWDFLGDDAPPAPAGPAPAVERRPEAAPSARSDTSLGVSPLALEADRGALLGNGLLARTLRASGHGLGWTLTLGLLSIGLTRGLFPGLQPIAQSPVPATAGPLAVQQVEGHWVETARAGTVFSVRGVIRNSGSDTLRPAGAWRVELLGSQGRPLDAGAAALGLPLPEAQLRELPREALGESLARAAADLRAAALPPGAQLPVQAVFEKVPDAAERFALAPGDARPAPLDAGPDASAEAAGGVEASPGP